MELDTLRLENFRQFYGTQELAFSRDTDRNVTVVYGSNGAGKSTILNAFLWLFYEELTLPQASRLPSERAMAECAVGDTVEVAVELEFDHEGEQFSARRSYRLRKGSPDDLSGEVVDDQLTVEYIDAEGNFKQRPNPENTLRQILPERLQDIFFFDGETIDELTQTDSQDRIQSSIRNIMGLEILERGIRHLGYVEGEFEDEMEEHGSEELSELVAEKQRLSGELADAEDELEVTKQSLSETKSELENVETRQDELEGSHDLQQERQRLREERTELEAEIAEINDEMRSAVSDAGHLVFAMPAIEKTARMLKKKRDKGEIPSEIKSQFVDDLLDLGECICGRPLEEGTEPFEEVRSWKQHAGTGDLEQVAMRIATRLSDMGQGQQDLFEELSALLSRRSAKSNRITEINGRLDDISTELSGRDTEEIGQLEDRRVSLTERISDLDRQIGAKTTEIADLEEQVEAVEAEIASARQENQLAETANRRRLAAVQLREQLEGLFKRYQDEVRRKVNDRVNDTFQRIIAKEYYAEIADDYSLRILKDVETMEAVEVAKSTGERQVASLSFIASLVSLARERYESDEEATYFTGGIYPILMDSPYGYLDPTYQRKVSRILPEMSQQVIVLVTKSQWSDAVREELDSIAGAKYHLEYENPTENDVRHEVTRIRSENPQSVEGR